MGAGEPLADFPHQSLWKYQGPTVSFPFLPFLVSLLLHPFLLVPSLPSTLPRLISEIGHSFPFSRQQELVNLLLTGRAVSNVFNDVVELDSGDGNTTLLRGIEARSDIGFLSLFEHYNVCQVPTCTLEPQKPCSLDP